MSEIKYLLGSEDICLRPRLVYSEMTVSFAAALSKALMRDAAARSMPDVQSFAFSCRPANLARWKANYGGDNEVRLGRGLSFHIAPSNVAVNFAFSFLFAALAGNACLVRVPSRPFPQVTAIINVMKSVLSDYPEMEKSTAFISYPASEETTADLCLRADCRVTWGGDETVSLIRGMKTKPHCVDLCFPDRRSFAVLGGEAIEKAGDAEMKALARGFYNDTYLMDQNACSSPHIIFWRSASKETKEKFWRAVEGYAAEKYVLQAASAVDKFDQSCRDAAGMEELSSIVRSGNLLYRAVLSKAPGIEGAGLKGQCGYFYECDLNDWTELEPMIDERFQTVVYFGINPEEIRSLIVQEGLRGIDRIVPVGSALDIGPVWDGFDIIRTLSRLVDLA